MSVEVESLVFENSQLQIILEAFIDGDLKFEELQAWAIKAEARDDIQKSKHATDVIFELANPEILEPIDKMRARKMIEYLDQADE